MNADAVDSLVLRLQFTGHRRRCEICLKGSLCADGLVLQRRIQAIEMDSDDEPLFPDSANAEAC